MIQNAMRLQALRAAGLKVSSRFGTVTGYDPNTYSVKVTIQPEGIPSGFIPLATPWAGSGWGLYAPPAIGSQVSVIFIDSELEAGFVELQFFNAQTQPTSVDAGEFWIVHKSGAFFKLLNAGGLSFSDANGATLSMDGAGNITSAGEWTHTGNMTVTETITANTDVVTGTISLKNHIHQVVGVQPGSSTIPTQPPS